MTAVDDAAAASSELGPADPTRLQSTVTAVEELLRQIGEHLNPILIKEARQAMKSRQFTVTFTLLLVFGWLWSIIGIATQMPNVYYAPTGLFMLTGYYFILAAPLLLVVPFSAYRSLASEREDGTYELLSISTLTARQIVTGKLGSALLQMMVYYSALAPCIAFTYLLRGVDIITVLLLLFYTFCISLLLSAIGLVFAGLARSRHWQTLISVILLLSLAGIAWGWAALVVMIGVEGIENIPVDEPLFWVAQLAVLSAAATYLALLILVAAAQNSFASDNRSSRIRVALLIQTAVFAGWVCYGWLEVRHWSFVLSAVIFGSLHWVVYGVMLSAESAKLSPRVRRQLPVSFMGRIFLTWFNPGSGTGYIFAVSNVTVLVLLAGIAQFLQAEFGIPNSVTGAAFVGDRVFVGAVLMLGYYIAYLGFGRIVIMMIPNRGQYGFLLPALIHVLLVLAGAAVPFFLQAWYMRFRDFNYTAWQSPNWFWTLGEAFGRGRTDALVIFNVVAAACVIFVINLLLTVREVEATRLDAPDRVKEDIAAAN